VRAVCLLFWLLWSDQQGIQEYNGGAVLGMAGKNCVAVACDMRYGAQMQTMAIDKNKVFKMHDR
jgi:20S proteasome subunit beta 3